MKCSYIPLPGITNRYIFEIMGVMKPKIISQYAKYIYKMKTS